MKPCPERDSEKVYRHKTPVSASGGYGPILLPHLNASIFSSSNASLGGR